jgi:signal recognition particle subunit SRP54
MFEDLSGKIEEALKVLKGQDKITESNIDGAIKRVKRALLEADVNLGVVNEFLDEVRKEAVGEEVVKGIRPDEKFIEIIHRKLVDILGGESAEIEVERGETTNVMLVGLQGAGKTTAAAKLGLYLKEKGLKVLLIAADTFRPAAKEQLKTLGAQTGIDVYTEIDSTSSNEIVEKGTIRGKSEEYDAVIIDTAGRLYVDEKLMNEIKDLKEKCEPKEVLLVVDAMIGQEAAELTKAFDDAVGITGAILTKMDGDSRGGAALSVKKISGRPIKFIGTGEKVEALERFYPERMASRILGMGDILSLVDKAQKEIELQDVESMQKKFEEATFDFNDFLKQMRLIKRMGSIGGLMKLMPGMARVDEQAIKSGEIQLQRIETVINSMTREERRQPMLLSNNRKRQKRIANGSGRTISEVEKMVRDFERMKVMMQGITKGNIGNLTNMLGLKEKNPMKRNYKQKDVNVLVSKKTARKKRKGFFEI